MSFILLTKKVRLNCFFSMNIKSAFGVATKDFFYGNAPKSELDNLKKHKDTVLNLGGLEEAKLLSEEVISFKCQDRIINLTVDISANNQLIGAAREISEFKLGYEPEIIAIIDLLTPLGATIYDVGANWGPISFQLALRPGFIGHVYSFEPQVSCFNNIEYFRKELSLQDCVFPQNIALSNKAGEVYLSNEDWSGNVSINDSSNASGEVCRTVRLDDLSFPAPQIIKIDVEGHEYKVIEGASNLLQRNRPFVIFEDWLDNQKNHFVQLKNYGYSFYFLGWFNPFSKDVTSNPPFSSEIQLLALQQFDLDSRHMLPNRINVLASPTQIVSL